MPLGDYKVRIEIGNRLVRRQFETVVGQKSELSILEGQSLERPDLLIKEISDDPDHIFDLVQNSLYNDEVGEIFLTSESKDQNLVLKAMRSGAREFFGPYTVEDEISSALDRFMTRQAKLRAVAGKTAKQSQVISFMGSKGGVGTTTLAVNLAVSLATNEPKQSVCLLDMNLFGDLPLFLEIDPTYTWREITKNISRLDETFLKNILAVDPSGVYVLPSPGYLDSQNMATPEVIERLFKVLTKMFDFVIIDTGQLLNDTALKVVELSDKVFLVSVQSLPCLAKTNKILRTFRDLRFPESNSLHIIINRHLKNSSITTSDVENSLEKKVSWNIPNDYESTMTAINKGQPLYKTASKKEITQSIRDLAASLVEDPEEDKKKKKKGLFSFLRK